MKAKRLITLIGLGLVTVAGGVSVHQPSAHAAYYRWTKTKTYKPVVATYQRQPGTTAYMWNAHHTAKLHNLKNYPTNTWYLSRSVKMTRGGKSAIYYQVRSYTGKVSGYVWRGYLTTQIATGYNYLTTYLKPRFIPEVIADQKATLKLFPGTKQDARLNLMALATGNDLSEPDTGNQEFYAQKEAAAFSDMGLTPLTDAEKKQMVTLSPEWDLTKKIPDGLTHMQAMQYFVAHYVKPSQYKGWSIGAYITPKAREGGVIKNVVYLLPPQ